MSMLVRIAIALALAIGVGLLMNYEEGIVIIELPPYSFEFLAKWVALAAIVSFVAVYLLVRLVTGTMKLPGALARFGRHRRHIKSLEAFNLSVMALNEGRHEQAEELASRAQKDPQMSGPAALVAARACHAVGAIDRRNRWLLSVEKDLSMNQARNIFLTEIALDEGRPADALVALEKAKALAADSMQTLRLSLRAQEQRRDWQSVLKTAEALQKKGGISEPAATDTRARAWRSLFADASELDQVRQLHKAVSRVDLKTPGVSEAAAEAYAAVGDHSNAGKLVESVMGQRLSTSMLVLYTRLDAIAARDRLRVAESWLNRYKDDKGSAMIQAALGRLCMHEGLWGKAEEFLKQANEKAPSPFTRLALAEMYDHIGRADEASGLYKSIARGQPLALGGPGRDGYDK
ncbi:MAG: heme biosynthesis HemY N-terminal domain-containing protein [Burkholderiaceae bacterium]